ncbi:MAG: hypothetical protein COA63_010875 [Methylophaga sp.]|nr:hypothetical protein [Methylophaga sp.]
MEPISIALALARLAPMVAGWVGGSNAEETVGEVIDIAKQVAGVSDPEDALKQIKNNPELTIAFQQAMNPVIIAKMQAQTQQLIAINTTMQAEAKSNDKYVRRWRPTFGYIIGLTWLIQMAALGVVMVNTPTDAPAVINSMASLSFMWGIALSVLGINVSKRSQDKALAAGHPPEKSIVRSLTDRWINSTNGDK